MVEVEQDGKRFLLRSEVQGTCGAVLRAAGVAVPPTVQQATLDPAAPEPNPGATPRMWIYKRLHYNRLRPYTVENQSKGFRGCSRFLAHFYSRAYPGGTTGPPCRTFRERFIPRTLALITNPLTKGSED